MAKSVAIIQSNYIPWKGYFDIIRRVDHFLLYDDVQYTRGDWRNRNQIKTPQGLHWLTIPTARGTLHRNICEIQISDETWPEQHWKTIRHNYRKAPCFDKCESFFANLYGRATSNMLSDVNYLFLSEICGFLGIKTRLEFSMNYQSTAGRTERLVDLCRQLGATKYVSGPSAKDYLDERLFTAVGIDVEYMDYSQYPCYRQLHGAFCHNVSIVDLILNEGRGAGRFIWGER
jgi:hypothetical protein